MNRNKKSEVISFIQNELHNSSFVSVVRYDGLNVKSFESFRVQINSAGASCKAIKKTLLNIAAQGSGFEKIVNYDIPGQVALVYSDDPFKVSKVVASSKLGIILSMLKNYELKDVKSFSQLNSLEELKGRIVAIMRLPVKKLINIMRLTVMKLIILIRRIHVRES